jgi:hypothetical protein
VAGAQGWQPYRHLSADYLVKSKKSPIGLIGLLRG